MADKDQLVLYKRLDLEGGSVRLPLPIAPELERAE